MTQKRPIVPGTVTDGFQDEVEELQNGDDLEIPNGRTVRSTSGLDLLAAGDALPRVREIPLQDPARGGLVILGQGSGTWEVATFLAGDGRQIPEVESPNYRTRIDGVYTNFTGAANAWAVGTVIRNAAGTRFYRVIQHTHVGPNGSFQLSLWKGTSTDETLEEEGTPANTWTGVTLSNPGEVTHYGNDSATGGEVMTVGGLAVAAEKAPFHGSGAVDSGDYNCIGSRQERNPSFAPIPFRYPVLPEEYSKSFEVPIEEFASGAVIELVMSGVWKNTTDVAGAVDSPQLVMCLNVGESIFVTTALGANNHRARIRFESPEFPESAGGGEVPFLMRITLQARRIDTDRTEGLIALLDFKSAEHDFIVGKHRGSDEATSPLNFAGFQFEAGDDTTNHRSKRYVGVWAAVMNNQGGAQGRGLASTGEFLVRFHAYQWRLIRGPI